MNKRNFLKSLISSVPVLSFLPFNLSKTTTVPAGKEEFWKISAMIDDVKWQFKLKSGEVFERHNIFTIIVKSNYIVIRYNLPHTFTLEETVPPNYVKLEYILYVVELKKYEN